MHKKMDRKQKIIFFAKLILTVIYIAGLSIAIYKQVEVKTIDEQPTLVFIITSIALFIFHILIWISPKSSMISYGNCIYSFRRNILWITKRA